MSGIRWVETLTEAREQTAESKKLLLTYVFSPG